MRKILLGILLVLLFLSGCGNKVEDNPNKEDNKNNDIEVKVEDITIKLNSKTSFNDMSFKYPLSATTMNVGTYYIMDYLDNGEFIFRIGIYRFENKTISQAMETNKAVSKGIKTVNGLNWNYYEGKSDDEKNMVNYAYQYNGDTYTVTFIYDKDINEFINAFMNTIEFNKKD